jgi:hypothetical protein
MMLDFLVDSYLLPFKNTNISKASCFQCNLAKTVCLHATATATATATVTVKLVKWVKLLAPSEIQLSAAG